jgi:signal transduction histidine kinase
VPARTAGPLLPAGPRWRLLLDAGLATGLLVLGLAEIWVPLSSRDGAGDPRWSTVAVVLATVPLLLRRSRPLAVVAVVSGAMVVVVALAPVYVLFYGTFLPLVVVTFSVARHARGSAPVVGAALVAAGIAVFTLCVPAQRTPDDIGFNAGCLLLAWLAGRGLAVHEHRAAVERRRAVETEVAAATLAMSAVLDERARIARELHDVVAHAVSLIVVQAGAAEPVVEENPDFVQQALRTIRSTGVGALAEMRRVVTVLREDDAGGPLAPQPGTDGLPELVQQALDAGLRATMTVGGTPVGLPAGLDLAVYRIAQEALSNTRRHAGASAVAVRLRYGADHLELEVRDDGVAASTGPPAPGGHGLVGMRERAALYGGTLTAGPDPDGGWTVRVRLPLAPA